VLHWAADKKKVSYLKHEEEGDDEKGVEVVVRDATFIIEGKKNFPALKFLRQCPPVLVAKPG
jgi:hypothetical protein